MKLFLFKIVQISGWFTFQCLLLSHKKINFVSFCSINVQHGYNKSLQLRCNSPYKTLRRNFGTMKKKQSKQRCYSRCWIWAERLFEWEIRSFSNKIGTTCISKDHTQNIIEKFLNLFYWIYDITGGQETSLVISRSTKHYLSP